MLVHNPALARHAKEAAIIGRMVVGFGELEFMACNLAADAAQGFPVVMKMLYRLRATSARINSADLLMQPAFELIGLWMEQQEAMKVLNYCLRIRNQYAHCNWGDDSSGLFFADVQDTASRSGGEWYHDYKHVDVPLLDAQEAYFAHARRWLFFLEHCLTVSRAPSELKRKPRIQAPPEQPQPPMHNLASQHIPLWLSEDAKALHIKRAQEAERVATQPVRLPSVPKLTEEEWLAKYRKEGRPLPEGSGD
jgi:hypothetical protein